MATDTLEKLRSAYVRRRHTSLLIAIVCALAVRPLIGDHGAAPAIFSVFVVGLLLLALVTIQFDEIDGEQQLLLVQRRRHRNVGWALAAVAVGERLYMLVSRTEEGLLIGTIAWFLFFVFVTWTLLRNLLRHKEVTGETISMSISIYLLLGFSWALFYAIILELQPGAFHFADPSLKITDQPQHVLPILIYFSLTTLSTVGFGDIAPATLGARYLAISEGITGQFYLAILVARLVGMQMSRRQEST